MYLLGGSHDNSAFGSLYVDRDKIFLKKLGSKVDWLIYVCVIKHMAID